MPHCGDKCEFVIGDVVSLSLPPRIGPMLNMKDAIDRIQPDQEYSTRSEGVESSRSGVTPHR